MGKIKIKPENKGKFTSWARSHGMTVQQAAAHILRNKEKYSPTLIKRANFARNASKWEDGGMMEYGAGGFMNALSGVASVLGPIGSAFSLGKGVVDMFGTINKQREEAKQAELAQERSLDSGQNAAQAGIVNQYPATFKVGGMFKGKKFGGKANAEVEGGEVVITPDGIQTNMKGPTHKQGGIDVRLPNQSLIISKKYAKEVTPYTSKINKSKEMLEDSGATKLAKNSSRLNLNKYYSKVLDVYNKQEKNKLAKGGQYKFFGGGTYDDEDSILNNLQYKLPLNTQGFRAYPYSIQNNIPTMLGNVDVYGNRPISQRRGFVSTPDFPIFEPGYPTTPKLTPTDRVPDALLTALLILLIAALRLAVSVLTIKFAVNLNPPAIFVSLCFYFTCSRSEKKTILLELLFSTNRMVY
jgi:hypothetical protein